MHSQDVAVALTSIDFRLFTKVTAKDVLQRAGWAKTTKESTQQPYVREAREGSGEEEKGNRGKRRKVIAF